MTAGPIVTYECRLSGRTHTIPSDDVRVMKSGDGDFVVACACGDDSLAEADERPHPTPDQFVNIDANAPSPSEWLRLEDCANGWYAVDPWEPPEEYTGTRAQRRARVRERAKGLADGTSGPIDGEHDEQDEAARKVPCPYCGASAGRKCQRPSGHRVRSCHAERKAALEGGEAGNEPEQAALGAFQSARSG
ncbi:zinc finger domain-containing protein [Natrinema ejinorense]|uniref:DNA-binding phage zinc finger domain-containing protein n=1 Tax=Natrinema ejinorense TaxID=373386 RepID=A0A2A5QP38_9EURY|nr:hypothetical protein [Natrinema ejinorense]PCR88618.1 hypothetical protein CP557_21525 [Natrinema ejinorense]